MSALMHGDRLVGDPDFKAMRNIHVRSLTRVVSDDERSRFLHGPKCGWMHLDLALRKSAVTMAGGAMSCVQHAA
jgi:hypothetical protein